jgi:Asp/Glu/hydantoin racemase
MKLLLVNPNMSSAMTDRLASVARRIAAPGTEIIPRTATRGFPYISSRTEAQIAGAIALEMIAAEEQPVDAVVIAAFGDPGLHAAREQFDIPVIGMAEAAILTACMLGGQFGIVTFTPHMCPWYRESVSAAGLDGRFAGFRVPTALRGAVTDAADTMRDDLKELATLNAREDGADAVILGGAPLAGLAGELADTIPAVLVDPVSAAVVQAEALARLSPRGAAHGSFARPAFKPNAGLPSALAARLSGESG